MVDLKKIREGFSFRGKRSVFLLLLLVIIITYWNLPKVFFQQDEWYGFGTNIYASSLSRIGWIKYWLSAPGYPFNYMLQDINMSLFKLNAKWWAYESMLLHLMVSFLFYLVTVRLTKNRLIALISSLIYATTSIHYQAVVWIVQSLNKQLPALFGLLSLYCFLRYLENRQNKLLISSLLMLLIGLTQRDTIIFLFLFLPVLYLSHENTQFKPKALKPLLVILGTFLAYSLLKLQFIILALAPHSEGNTVGPLTLPSPLVFFSRVFTLPLRIIPQAFLSQNIIIGLARVFTRVFSPELAMQRGTTHYDVLIESTVSRQIIYILDIIIILLLAAVIYLLYRNRKNNYIKYIILSLVFIMLSAIPYAIIPGQVGYAEFLDPRYLYVSTMGMAWLLGTILVGMIEIWIPRLEGRWPLRKWLLLMLIPGLVGFNMLMTTSIVNAQVKRSKVEEYILNSVKEAFPQIAEKSIFYIESNKIYHGQTETILPFQCGAGQVLLVSYAYEGFYGPDFFQGNMPFYNLLFQGHEEHGNKAFGYYRDYNTFTTEAKKFDFNAYHIYSFRWDADKQIIQPTVDSLANDKKAFCISTVDFSLLDEQACDGKCLKYNVALDQVRMQGFRFPLLSKIRYPRGWFIANYIKKEDYETIRDAVPVDGNKDYFRLYNYGLNKYYGGTILVRFEKGNGTNKYVIPSRMYGYRVIGVSSANLVGKVMQPKSIVLRKDGNWEITFPYDIGKDKVLNFFLNLEAKLVYFIPQQGVEDIVYSHWQFIQGDGEKRTFIINTEGEVRAVLGYYIKDDIGYLPFGYSEDVTLPIKSISGLNTRSLTIEFREPPANGVQVRIPVLISFKPSEDVLILEALFSESEK